MDFERLRRNHLKRNIVIGVVGVLLISAVVLNFTRAKYRVTQSIPLVNGTINYTPYDFKMVAMYQENDNGEYVEIEKMPSSGYTINEEKSYCEINGEKDNNTKLYTNSNSEHVIANLQKGTKCYLYFDEYVPPETMTEVIAEYNKSTRADFNVIITEETTKKIYYANTSKGITYYFAGNPTDNWVYFAGYYWRIIRINENGSIRLIYQGTSANSNGIDTFIKLEDGSTKTKYNGSFCNSESVGLKYSQNMQHGNQIKSVVLTELDKWYSQNLTNYESIIDDEIGFCNDRNIATGYTWVSKPVETMYYAAYDRLSKNKIPTFECNNNDDLLKIPIGLITADEVIFAGGSTKENNADYYLYTGQEYWTMTPAAWTGPLVSCGDIYAVRTSGNISSVESDWAGPSIRPVINLKADVQFIGNGTADDPYVVSN